MESSRSLLYNATRTTQFGVSYKEQCANHWRLHELNQVWTERSSWSKTGITPSYGIGFQRISTRWKDNFRGYPLDLLFEVCSIRDQRDIPWRRRWQLQWWWLPREDDGNNGEESLGSASMEFSWSSSVQGCFKDIGTWRHKRVIVYTSEVMIKTRRRYTIKLSSCMDTSDSYSKDHGFTSMKVNKKSSFMTLN